MPSSFPPPATSHEPWAVQQFFRLLSQGSSNQLRLSLSHQCQELLRAVLHAMVHQQGPGVSQEALTRALNLHHVRTLAQAPSTPAAARSRLLGYLRELTGATEDANHELHQIMCIPAALALRQYWPQASTAAILRGAMDHLGFANCLGRSRI